MPPLISFRRCSAKSLSDLGSVRILPEELEEARYRWTPSTYHPSHPPLVDSKFACVQWDRWTSSLSLPNVGFGSTLPEIWPNIVLLTRMLFHQAERLHYNCSTDVNNWRRRLQGPRSLVTKPTKQSQNGIQYSAKAIKVEEG